MSWRLGGSGEGGLAVFFWGQDELDFGINGIGEVAGG